MGPSPVAARAGDLVPLGRKYPITAGLLEITYDSGAKVIVQGPAIYSASSYNGGGLYFGKLTASAGKLDRARLIVAERARGHVPPFAYRGGVLRSYALGSRDRPGQPGGPVRRRGGPLEGDFRARSQGSINVGTKGFEGPYPASAGTCVWTGAGAEARRPLDIQAWSRYGDFRDQDAETAAGLPDPAGGQRSQRGTSRSGG